MTSRCLGPVAAKQGRIITPLFVPKHGAVYYGQTLGSCLICLGVSTLKVLLFLHMQLTNLSCAAMFLSFFLSFFF